MGDHIGMLSLGTLLCRDAQVTMVKSPDSGAGNTGLTIVSII